MRRYLRHILLLILAIASISGTMLYVRHAKNQEFSGTIDPRLIVGLDRFAFKLMAQLAQSPQENVLCSPVGVYTSLSMLSSGAAGDTQKALLSALGVDTITSMELAKANGKLLESMERAGPKVNIATANSLWVDKGIEPRLTYTQDTRNDYGAEVASVDFKKPGAVDEINKWAAKATNGLIKNAMSAGDLSGAKCVISNAVYFRGEWQARFDPERTKPAKFTCDNGRTVNAEMMHASVDAKYFAIEGLQVLALPYGKGRMSMVVLLPERHVDLRTMLAGFNAAQWEILNEKMSSKKVNVSLPRFTAHFDAGLKPALTAMGLGCIFDPSADLSGVAPMGLFVSDAKHSADIAVDEKGTVAAAVTNVTLAIGVKPAGITFIADHPFFYAIRDNKTQAILFMGMVTNPKP